ncbi:Hypothetical protein D9617_3g018660 [Elsinoe fawcettii]|nr:Hypothetical protein D9617_3g018660 [Elsinoe fawcettii]
MRRPSPASSTASFHSFSSRSSSPAPNTSGHPPPSSKPNHSSPTDLRLPAEEESSLLLTSSTLKTEGNALFARASFSDAISTYDRALASVPNYLDYELAVLRSNIAACHIKLAEWKEAIESADKAIENLRGLDGKEVVVKSKVEGKDTAVGSEEGRLEQRDDEGKVQEVDDETERALERLKESGHTLEEVQKLRAKVLMRRAKARTEMGGWSHLQGAEEDYRYLLKAPRLSATDLKTVQGSYAALGPRLDDAKQKEMAEMMGKLKGLGNSLLKPFGLSTENFQFVKDQNTGGYSMNFQQ